MPGIVHREKAIAECAATCADAFPDARLTPPADARADYYRWLFFAAGPVEHGVTNKSMGFTPTEQQRRMAGYGHYDLMVDVLKNAVAANDYIAGSRFSAADVYLGSQVAWGVQFGTLPSCDAFTAYVERLMSRAAYKRAKALDDALLPIT